MRRNVALLAVVAGPNITAARHNGHAGGGPVRATASAGILVVEDEPAVREAVERLRGSATVKMTTEEIMALTRG